MKIVKADAKLLNKAGMTDYQFLEKIGRICYKSEDHITEGSAARFVKSLVARKHFAMLEHLTVRFRIEYKKGEESLYDLLINEADRNPDSVKYFRINHGESFWILSGSIRSFYDYLEHWVDTLNDKLGVSLDVAYMLILLSNTYPEIFAQLLTDDIQAASQKCHKYFGPDGTSHYIQLMSEEDFNTCLEQAKLTNNITLLNLYRYHKTHTALFICDRGVSHELVRHRPCSFAQESTRYCNYSKDKFGNELTVIEPCFFEKGSELYGLWYKSCLMAEYTYFNLLCAGATPQQARDVLPTSVKTEIVLTAYEDEWQHIIDLRYHGTTGAPHPQMLEVMTILAPQLFACSNLR